MGEIVLQICILHLVIDVLFQCKINLHLRNIMSIELDTF